MKNKLNIVSLIAITLIGCSQKPNAKNSNSQNSNTAEASAVALTPTDSAIDLYGEPVDESAVPAKNAPPQSYMRPRKGDSVFRLSNPRFLSDREKPFPQLKVDFERIRSGEFNGQSLMVQHVDGRTQQYLLMSPFTENRGTIEINVGFAPPGQNPPKNAELFLTRNDPRWGPQSPTFKVSNSVFLGTFDPSKQTLVRNWTTEEADRLRKPPPAYATQNTKDGHDTEFAGDTTGGVSFRFVDPEQLMIGVDYTTGSWAGVNCIGSLTPVYSKDQPNLGGTRVIAKQGLVLAGVEVQSKTFVTAIRLLYRNPASTDAGTTTSEWFGFPDAEAEKKMQKLAGKGEKVIGIHMKKGAILNGLALVTKE